MMEPVITKHSLGVSEVSDWDNHSMCMMAASVKDFRVFFIQYKKQDNIKQITSFKFNLGPINIALWLSVVNLSQDSVK